MINLETEKKWVWDEEENQLVERTQIFVQLVGTAGSVFLEEGPLMVKDPKEIIEAFMLLRSRLQKKVADSIDL